MASSSDNEYEMDASAPPDAVTTEAIVSVRAKSEIPGCVCEIDPITLRRFGAAGCPVHPRVTHASIAWEQIPEQATCICAHVKGVHQRRAAKAGDSAGPAYDGRTHCGGGNGPAFRKIASAIDEVVGAGAKLPEIKLPAGCRCPGFQDADQRMEWGDFAARLLFEVDTGCRTDESDCPPHVHPPNQHRPNLRARARVALGWAWKKSGLDMEKPRTWAQWIADSKRVWRAWREAGSPIEAFGREVPFGPCSIPALGEGAR